MPKYSLSRFHFDLDFGATGFQMEYITNECRVGTGEVCLTGTLVNVTMKLGRGQVLSAQANLAVAYACTTPPFPTQHSG